MLSPEDAFGAGAIARGVTGLLNKGKKAAPTLQKAGLGRVPRDGGVVDKSGLPGKMDVMGETKALGNPSNLEKVGRNEFTEVEKRANMFGGAKVEGQAVKPNARQPMSFPEAPKTATQLEAERLIQEIMRGKTGGSLPNNAPRGARLKNPKAKK
jgi:hypothetical protein